MTPTTKATAAKQHSTQHRGLEIIARISLIAAFASGAYILYHGYVTRPSIGAANRSHSRGPRAHAVVGSGQPVGSVIRSRR